jgi:hypothetical protein
LARTEDSRPYRDDLRAASPPAPRKGLPGFSSQVGLTKEAASGRIERTVPIRSESPSEEGLEVGEDTGTPVNRSYDVPFGFPVRIEKPGSGEAGRRDSTQSTATGSVSKARSCLAW